MKIIHVNNYPVSMHTPPDIFSTWSSRIAKLTVEYSNKFKVECWFPERDIATKKIEKDRITYRFFPSLGRFLETEISPTLIKALTKVVTSKDKVLVLTHGVSYPLSYFIYAMGRKIPIIGQDHGDVPSMSSMWSPLKKIVENRVFRNVDLFHVLTEEKKDFLIKERRVDPSKVFVRTMGVHFQDFIPINKIKARKLLGLPLDKKIALYVGHFYKGKGVDHILRAYPELKKKGIEVVLVGGNPKDELFENVRHSGMRFFTTRPHKEMNLFFSAADVYLMPGYSGESIRYGGIGIATVEALACNVPVVSANLRHFPGSEFERQSIGVIPDSYLTDDIVQKVLEVVSNPKKFRNCRKIAKKYYSLDTIVRTHIKDYERLFEVYYG